jgi:signal transduction histidine kinase/CheY-like chemotaxis protein
MYELGYRTTELLYQFILQGYPEKSVVRIPTRLVIRESCGCLPGAVRLSGSDTSRPASIEEEMADAVFNDVNQVRREEIVLQCRDLTKNFRASLEYSDPVPFHSAIQSILDTAAVEGQDLSVWQKAITILRERIQEMAKDTLIDRLHLADRLLDYGRVAISDRARREYSRISLNASRMAEIHGQMAAHFLSAQDETVLFDVFGQYLSQLGIHHAATFTYEPDGDDRVAWSRLQGVHSLSNHLRLFPSRQFPPPGLYPESERQNLVLMPMQSPEGAVGFIAYEATSLDNCALITTELMAALKGIRLYQSAVEAQKEAEEANHLKSRFLSMVSHELRTPLNLISGLSNMLLKDRPNGEAQGTQVNWDDLERIYISSQHLDGLIRDVLDLARIDVGKLSLVREPLDLAEVFQAAGAIGERLAREKGLAWHMSLAANLPHVSGDRTRLRQVILNLVNNAVKFTSTGEVRLSAVMQNGKVLVSVSDTGLGISPEDQHRIFDEFRQSDRTAARGFGGLGLGLAICKRLVEMHGGEIYVRSSGKEDEGSTFFFTLPALSEGALPLQPESVLGGAREVLVLVMDLGAGEVMRAHLIEQGFYAVVHQVENGSDWFSWVLLEDPDAVVLDLALTTKSGWEIVKVLKDNPATNDLPVLFYTLENGCDCGDLFEMNYLSKPVLPSQLEQALAIQGLRGQPGGIKRNILVVDDDPNMLNLNSRQIRALSADFQIHQAENGLRALEIIRQVRPDLVLLDLMMPDLDGFGVLEAIHADPTIRGTAVIVVTGQVLTEEDMQRLNQGVASVLRKGMFSSEETLQHVKVALARRRRPGSETHRAVLKAMAYIHTHYADPVSRGDVAAYVGLSERHLTRCFRQETGLTPITYLNRYRVQQAKELMRAGKRGITEIALEVGFSNSGYFTKVFRDETGLSPRAYLQDT